MGESNCWCRQVLNIKKICKISNLCLLKAGQRFYEDSQCQSRCTCMEGGEVQCRESPCGTGRVCGVDGEGNTNCLSIGKWFLNQVSYGLKTFLLKSFVQFNTYFSWFGEIKTSIVAHVLGVALMNRILNLKMKSSVSSVCLFASACKYVCLFKNIFV